MTAEQDARRIANNLGKVAASTVKDVDAVMKRGAQNLKDDLAADARSSEHFKGMAGAISYDAMPALNRISYEVGPDKARRGGALGNIYYFGTSRGGGTGDLDGPVEREGPRLEQNLLKLADEMGRRI